MKVKVTALLALVLLVSVVPMVAPAHAQGSPQITVYNHYVLNRYGFAVVTEMITFHNNESSAVQAPVLSVGVGNLSSLIADFNYTGTGFIVTRAGPTSGEFIVGGGPSVPAGGDVKVTLQVLIKDAALVYNNFFRAQILGSPSLSLRVETLHSRVQMPTLTQLTSPPPGMQESAVGGNITYSSTRTGVGPQNATTFGKFFRVPGAGISPDFHKIGVTSATRTISTGPDGLPVVTDSLDLVNIGPTTMSVLYVSPLTSPSASVTVLAGLGPRLLSTARATLSNGGLTFTPNGPIGSPIPEGARLKITYSYSLSSKYYTTSGGQVTLTIPLAPPISTFVDSYSISSALPAGVKLTQGAEETAGGLSPWSGGQVGLSYTYSVGWPTAAGAPTTTAIFLLLLLGLYASRTTETEEEETEEETSTERATDMVTAFDEKTSLINELWPTIAGEDPNRFDKRYFDELRGRMDSFKGRALQRLNEMKQRSATQKFADLLTQIQTTEREVDRAAKDKLNLYEQYYMRRMRKEVFDRLLPQYTKRLEKALNQLSDELHVVQKEAKLL